MVSDDDGAYSSMVMTIDDGVVGYDTLFTTSMLILNSPRGARLPLGRRASSRATPRMHRYCAHVPCPSLRGKIDDMRLQHVTQFDDRCAAAAACVRSQAHQVVEARWTYAMCVCAPVVLEVAEYDAMIFDPAWRIIGVPVPLIQGPLSRHCDGPTSAPHQG